MADAIAGIVERLTFHWNEFPVIFSAGQGEFKDAVSLPVPHFAVGSGHAQRAVAPSARSNNDFADSTRGVWISLGILRSKPLVGMFVARQNQVRVDGVKVLPERPQARVQGVLLEKAAAKKRVVPVSENACIRILR